MNILQYGFRQCIFGINHIVYIPEEATCAVAQILGHNHAISILWPNIQHQGHHAIATVNIIESISGGYRLGINRLTKLITLAIADSIVYH